MNKKIEYERIEANFVKFTEKGQQIEGKILDVDIETSKDFAIYTIQDDNGITRQFHDSKQLKDLLLQCNIGDYIIVTFVDTQNLPNGELKIFTVDRSK